MPQTPSSAALATTFLQEATKLAAVRGPLFRHSLFHLEFTFVTGPDLVAELSDEHRFTKHVHANLVAMCPFLGDGLLTVESGEPAWQTGHDVLSPGFTKAAMHGHHDVMLDVTRQLQARWDQAVAGEPIDLMADLLRTTQEIIGRAGFGYSFSSFERERPHPFMAALTGATLYGLRSVTRPPLMGGLLGDRAARNNAEDIATMNDIVDEVIDSKQAEPGDDLLGMMLRSGRMDRDNIRNQVITFLAAGHETTYGALGFGVNFLFTHPEILARARAEVDKMWGTAEPDYTQVSKLRYLRRVVDETLRLWPTGPGYARQARESTLLGGSYPVSAGEPLFVLLPALHRDRVWGDHPEVFDPDRFLPDRVRARPAHAYKPFGTGARACIGRQFALHQIVLVLGLLLRRFDLTLPDDHELQVSELMTLRPDRLIAQVTHRRLN
ncbi:cytochrome P450 [Amycolatopsis sp. EV170708-02-1]|uniref:cytochrome P450 n=1 Tax=Amycolatopsis sp. EV170708-02-1 TaxID=2919322 RepID=UPI001F0C43CC|nr:cytochrome P450 [Amycolatopsis sp. EV170708-02-1]UMP06991.1 cytochrome P450 [Amycolatopsis sp. EV170708-02-1]